MNRGKLVPIIGIATLVLMIGISSYRENTEKRNTYAPPVPVITSELQPMTLDEIHYHLKKALDASMPEHYAIMIDKDAKTITIDTWPDGFNIDVVNAALQYSKYLQKWHDSLSSTTELCKDIRVQVTNHGHPEMAVIMRLMNCDSVGQVFAVIEDGEIVYDIVEETPAGELVENE